LIPNGDGEFDEKVIAFINNFKTYDEQLFETYNGSHCGMVLMKNETTSTKGD
jgi:hypothetical protein